MLDDRKHMKTSLAWLNRERKRKSDGKQIKMNVTEKSFRLFTVIFMLPRRLVVSTRSVGWKWLIYRSQLIKRVLLFTAARLRLLRRGVFVEVSHIAIIDNWIFLCFSPERKSSIVCGAFGKNSLSTYIRSEVNSIKKNWLSSSSKLIFAQFGSTVSLTVFHQQQTINAANKGINEGIFCRIKAGRIIKEALNVVN